MTTTVRRHPHNTTTHPAVILPFLPDSIGVPEREIYMAFIRSFREGPSRRMSVRIMTAIHKTADMTENSDAYVSRVLVDMGLMAPRLAFPCDFLDHVDATLLRDRPLISVPAGYVALTRHWQAIGDDSYATLTACRGPGGSLHSFLARA